MPAPCNAKPISLGSTPWNLYPACNVDTNGHIELECFNLITPYGTIPLGSYELSAMSLLCKARSSKSGRSDALPSRRRPESNRLQEGFGNHLRRRRIT